MDIKFVHMKHGNAVKWDEVRIKILIIPVIINKMNRKEIIKPKTYTPGTQPGSTRLQKGVSPLDNNHQMPFKSGRKRHLTTQSSRNHTHEKKLAESKIYFYKHLLREIFCKTF